MTGRALRALPFLLLLLLAAHPARGESRFQFGQLQERMGKHPFPFLDRANSDNVPVAVEADTLRYDDDTGVAVAEGNVEVTFAGRVFRARKIQYDSRRGEAFLEGDVKFGGPEGSFSFQRILVSVPDGTGHLDNGTIDLGEGNYRITSERIEKTGEKDYFMGKGSFTTCPCDPVPDWSLGAERLHLTVDGYAVGRNVIFRIREYPVLWLPWGIFPAKVTRQSGFLLPTFGQSGSKGATMTLPFYWAVNRWSDATLTLEGMTRRGVRPEAEYRYVLNDRSEGTVRGSFLRDTEAKENLWRAWGENYTRLSDRFSLNAKWDTASGGEYYREYSGGDMVRKARHVPSRGTLEDRGSTDVLSLSFDTAKESQLPSQPGKTPHRLPEATERLLPWTLPGGFDFRADAAAAHLSGNSQDNAGSRSESRGRGFFELSRPTRLGPYASATPFAFLDLLGSRPSGTDNGTDYPWRAVPGAGMQLSTALFRENPRPAGHSYVHTVRPSLAFRWTPLVQQDDIPLSDEWSRLSNRSRFTFDLSQSLHRIDADGKDPRELLTLDVQWAYDAGNLKSSGTPYIDPLSPFSVALRDEIDDIAGRDRRERSGSDVLVYGRFNPYAKHRFTGDLLYDPEESSVTHGSGAYEYGKKGEDRLRLEYRMTRGLSEEVKALFSWRVLPFLRLGSMVDYSIRTGALTEGTAQALYLPRSGCWTLGVVGAHTTLPKETSGKVVFSLVGLGGNLEVE